MALTGAHLALAAAVLLSPACASAAAPPPLDGGWTEFEARHYEQAIGLWREEAAGGDAQAELGLGIAYDLGQGVASDADQACDWYRRAGDDGVARAEFNLAVMRDSGRCGDRDAGEAALWYGRAGARGHARAQYDLGQMYASGDGVPRNAQLAHAWFDAAAANGVPAAAEAGKRLAPSHGAELSKASPLWPRTVDVRAGGPKVDVPLVWTSAEQPETARFYVEVYDVGGGAPRLVHTGYEPRSAAVVSVGPGTFSWRVLTADAPSGSYEVGEWSTFTVEPRPQAAAQ